MNETIKAVQKSLVTTPAPVQRYQPVPTSIGVNPVTPKKYSTPQPYSPPEHTCPKCKTVYYGYTGCPVCSAPDFW